MGRGRVRACDPPPTYLRPLLVLLSPPIPFQATYQTLLYQEKWGLGGLGHLLWTSQVVMVAPGSGPRPALLLCAQSPPHTAWETISHFLQSPLQALSHTGLRVGSMATC